MSKIARGKESLSSAAACNGLFYGTAVSTDDLLTQSQSHAILRECGLITPEYEMKWNCIADRPRAGYAAADKLVDFASDNNLAVHGHTLWWHEAIPAIHGAISDKEFAE